MVSGLGGVVTSSGERLGDGVGDRSGERVGDRGLLTRWGENERERNLGIRLRKISVGGTGDGVGEEMRKGVGEGMRIGLGEGVGEGVGEVVVGNGVGEVVGNGVGEVLVTGLGEGVGKRLGDRGKESAGKGVGIRDPDAALPRPILVKPQNPNPQNLFKNFILL